jgi:hypothetical protein
LFQNLEGKLFSHFHLTCPPILYRSQFEHCHRTTQPWPTTQYPLGGIFGRE